MAPVSIKGLALAATSLLSSVATATQYLTVEGSNFVTNSTGDRFVMYGVDYQPGGSSGLTSTSDPLSDGEACLRDAILMQRLGVNTIRVYNLDADINHDECASIFNAAGIYMLLDVNSGVYGTYIDRTEPASTYTLTYLKHVFSIIEAFSGYPNLLGFFAGNEIINEESAEKAPEYIRAVVRDMKEYIANNIDRSIGVGYSAADVSDMLTDTWNYLGCELSDSTYSKIDFFGLNDYEWCGDSSYTASGYNELVELFASTSIPVFFSEYGCNAVQPRTFTEVSALYGDNMTVLSGGLVYEWTEESDDYGIVDINSTSEVTLRSDYVYLGEELAKVDVDSLTKANSTAESKSATSCKASLITESSFLTSWSLPTRPSGADALVTSGISSGFSKGSIVSVTKTTMPATVINTAGATVTGLKLVVLDDDDSNYPGLTENYTSSDDGSSSSNSTTSNDSSSSSNSSSSSSSSSNSSYSSGASSMAVVQTGLVATAAFVVSLLFL